MSDQIATYTFLPWLRQGIVSKVKNEDTLGEKAGPVERTSVLVSLTVNGQKNFVTQNVQLIGPGDVIGVSPRAVVRTEPRHWITDFEPNYLAFVEFYEEDFPWRFTPARAVRQNLAGNPASSPKQTKLRPWIFLLALEESEFEEISSLSQPLASIRLVETTDVDAVLPPSDESWWALAPRVGLPTVCFPSQTSRSATGSAPWAGGWGSRSRLMTSGEPSPHTFSIMGPASGRYRTCLGIPGATQLESTGSRRSPGFRP